jgi:hypothetical protein
MFLVAMILPGFLTAGFLNCTKGWFRVIGVTGTFVFPLILFVWSVQSTAVNLPEGEDGEGAGYLLAAQAYLVVLWFISALVGCLAGWLTLRGPSRRGKSKT